MPIKKIRIFPPLGIARVGDSDSDFFIGPELPGAVTAPPGGYRDGGKHIKRQGARFHLFGYDENDQLVGELTEAEAEIKWTVHLANTKASAEWFGRKDDPRQLRNADVTTNREQLNLDAGEQTVGGKNRNFPDLSASRAQGQAIDLEVNTSLWQQQVSVLLGTILTDDRGLLIVLGGKGKAESPTGRDLNAGPSNFANHDQWYDDVGDGPVTAQVKLSDGSSPEVVPAWVITAPPKYAPEIHHPVTLYDTLLQAMVDHHLLQDPTAAVGYQPVFSRDVFPILKRAFNMRWVFANGATQLPNINFHRIFNKMPPPARSAVFNKLGQPAEIAGAPAIGGGDMPKMWSDAYDKAFRNGTLTRIQYKNMSLWSAGTFVDDSQNMPAPLTTITPEGLTQAALEPCIGGPFYPGIEASWKLRDEYPFLEPFRLDTNSVKAGDITKQMSLPWQSDFLDCGVEDGGGGTDFVWWPAQRPWNVLSSGKSYVSWARTTAGGDLSPAQMVTDWWRLGFVLRQDDNSFVETGRID